MLAEGTTGVTEELGLEQFVGKRRAVEIAEAPLTARAQAVDRARDEFLADSLSPSNGR